jgi:hypothetical protein
MWKPTQDGWPNEARLSDIEPGFVCSRCGKKGADVRPKFPQAKMGAQGGSATASRKKLGSK